MPVITARLDADLSARFETAAAAYGGKSALLRALLQNVLPDQEAPPRSDEAERGAGEWLSLQTSMSAADALRVRATARREGLTASQWLRAAALERMAEAATSAQETAGPEGEAGENVSAKLVRVVTHLVAKEAAALGVAARARGMRPSAWLRSLIAVRLGKGAQYSGQEQVALGRLAAEVSRVGVNLNQVVRLAHEARKMGKPISLDVATIEAAKAAVTHACATFLEVAKGNVRYWEDGR